MSEVVITQYDTQTLEMAREDIVRVEGQTELQILSEGVQGPPGPQGEPGPAGTQALAADERAHLLALPLAGEIVAGVGVVVADATAPLATSAELADVAGIVQTLPAAIPSLTQIEGAVNSAAEPLAKQTGVDAARDAVLAAIASLPPPAPSAFVGEVREFASTLVPAGWQICELLEVPDTVATLPPVLALTQQKAVGAVSSEHSVSGTQMPNGGPYVYTSVGPAAPSAEIYAFTPDEGDSWQASYGAQPSVLPPSAAIRGGKLVLCGGASGSAALSRHIEIDAAGVVTVLSTTALTARAAHGAVGVGIAGTWSERLIVIGGASSFTNGQPSNALATCQIYVKNSNSWYSFASLPGALRYVKAGVLPSGRVFAYGEGAGSVAAIADPDANGGAGSWTPWIQLPAPPATRGAATLLQTVEGVAYLATDGRFYEYVEAAAQSLNPWRVLPHRLAPAVAATPGDTLRSFSAGASVLPTTIGGTSAHIIAPASPAAPFLALLSAGTAPAYIKARYIGDAA